MKEVMSICKIFKKICMKIELLCNTWAGRACLLTSFTFPLFSHTFSPIQVGLMVLLGAYIFDFLTGWLASYMEIKRGDKPPTRSGYAFESTRARESVVKGVCYITFILGVLALEYLFIDKKFEITQLSTKKLGLTEVIIGFCIGIELYSTVIENSKRAGFDLIAKVKSAATTLWDLYKKIKGGE